MLQSDLLLDRFHNANKRNNFSKYVVLNVYFRNYTYNITVMEVRRTTKECLNCGSKLTGRRDKKFCDAQCKAEFHNKNRSYGELYISSSQSITRHNRRILKTLCPEGKATVRKEVLDIMGYDFRYFSGLYKTSANLYYLAYDYAFAPIYEKGVEKALIVQRQDYMDQLTLAIWKKPGSKR